MAASSTPVPDAKLSPPPLSTTVPPAMVPASDSAPSVAVTEAPAPSVSVEPAFCTVPASCTWPLLSVMAPRPDSNEEVNVPPSARVALLTRMVPVLLNPAVARASVAPLLTPMVPWLAKLPLPTMASISPATPAVMVPALTRLAGRPGPCSGLTLPTTTSPCPAAPRSHSPAPSVSVAPEVAPPACEMPSVAAPAPPGWDPLAPMVMVALSKIWLPTACSEA